MQKEFCLPDLGSGLQEGQVVTWLVEVGQDVTTTDNLCELETEKAVIEIPVPCSGTVLELKVDAGDTIEVGAVLAVFGIEEGAPDDAAEERPAGPAEDHEETSQRATVKAASERGGHVRAMPSIRRLAAEHGIDLASVEGTGRNGRITRNDVLAVLKTAQAAEPVEPAEPATAAAPTAAPAAAATPAGAEASEFEKFSMLRRTISERLSRSWREIPHVFSRMEIDATRLLVVRKALVEDLELKVPIEAILVRACLPALKEFPHFNATVVEDGIQLHKHYNIGVAADTETGLLVPVVKSADQLSFRATVDVLLDLLPRALERKATPEELTGATFTVNNIGALGHLMGSSIIPEGTTAILSIGRVVEKPIVRDGEIVACPVLEVTLSFDHRAIDGGLAQRFMARIRENLEEPAKVLL